MKDFIYNTKPNQIDMKHFLCIISVLCCMCISYAQDTERVEVSGQIYVAIDDVENVTVYNASTNKGAITDSEGAFKIVVGLNDEIQVSALQLKPFKTKITEEVVANKSLKIYLVEQINSLAEVVLLPYNLTGHLETDVANVKVVDPLVFSFGSFENFEMPPDYKTKVENIAMNQGQIRYQADFVAILSGLVGLLVKNKKKRVQEQQNPRLETPISIWADAFSEDYYIANFNIPKENVSEFVSFLERQNGPEQLLQDENEMQRIDFLHQQSELFLKGLND